MIIRKNYYQLATQKRLLHNLDTAKSESNLTNVLIEHDAQQTHACVYRAFIKSIHNMLLVHFQQLIYNLPFILMITIGSYIYLDGMNFDRPRFQLMAKPFVGFIWHTMPVAFSIKGIELFFGNTVRFAGRS